MNTDHLFKSKPRTRVKGQRRPGTKSKKIRSGLERQFQEELKRIRDVTIPSLPKEAKLPEPVLIKPKAKPKRMRRVLDKLRGKNSGRS
jgi:hypothetical protein